MEAYQWWRVCYINLTYPVGFLTNPTPLLLISRVPSRYRLEIKSYYQSPNHSYHKASFFFFSFFFKRFTDITLELQYWCQFNSYIFNCSIFSIWTINRLKLSLVKNQLFYYYFLRNSNDHVIDIFKIKLLHFIPSCPKISATWLTTTTITLTLQPTLPKPQITPPKPNTTITAPNHSLTASSSHSLVMLMALSFFRDINSGSLKPNLKRESNPTINIKQVTCIPLLHFSSHINIKPQQILTAKWKAYSRCSKLLGFSYNYWSTFKPFSRLASYCPLVFLRKHRKNTLTRKKEVYIRLWLALTLIPPANTQNWVLPSNLQTRMKSHDSHWKTKLENLWTWRTKFSALRFSRPRSGRPASRKIIINEQIKWIIYDTLFNAPCIC